MFQLLGVAWTAWKLGAKRFGPVGALAFAGGAVVAWVLLKDYIEKNHPELDRRVESAL